jgi:hypothetical protein
MRLILRAAVIGLLCRGSALSALLREFRFHSLLAGRWRTWAVADERNLDRRSLTPAGVWNRKAIDLGARYRLHTAEAAHVLAALNVALVDGLVACWRAKLEHWSVRPVTVMPDSRSVPNRRCSVRARQGCISHTDVRRGGKGSTFSGKETSFR